MWLWRALPADISVHAPNFDDRKRWQSMCWVHLLIGGMIVLTRQSDVVMVGVLVNTTEAGYYSAATRLADLAVFALTSANMVLTPLLSEYYAAGKQHDLQRLLRRNMQFVALATLFITAVLVVLGEWVLGLFGDGFVAAYLPLIILLVAQAVNALVGPVGFLLLLADQQRLAMRVMCASLVLNIGLNLLLIPQYAMLGAAVATAISIVFWNVVMWWCVRRKLTLEPSILGLIKRQ